MLLPHLWCAHHKEHFLVWHKTLFSLSITICSILTTPIGCCTGIQVSSKSGGKVLVWSCSAAVTMGTVLSICLNSHLIGATCVQLVSSTVVYGRWWEKDMWRQLCISIGCSAMSCLQKSKSLFWVGKTQFMAILAPRLAFYGAPLGGIEEEIRAKVRSICTGLESKLFQC